MMIEVAVTLVLAGAGWLATRAVDHRPGMALALALPLGTAVYVAVMLALFVTGLGIARPLIGLTATAGIATGLRIARSPTAPVTRARLLIAVGAATALVAVLTAALATGGFVSVSADSFRYLTVAGVLDLSGDASLASAFLFESRGLAVGALHALSADAAGFLAVLSPLFAIAILATLWAALHRAGHAHPRGVVRAVALAAVLLLAVNERFLFHSLYISAHLFVAGWVLILQLRTFDATGRSSARPQLDLLLDMCLVAALVTARPEGALLAALVLVPPVLDPGVASGRRTRLLVALGVPILVWHGGALAGLRLVRGESLPLSVLGMVSLGLAALVGAAVASRLRPDLIPTRSLLWTHLAVWGALGVLAARDPGILYYSVRATWRNVLFDGGWGSSLLLLAVLLAAALALVTFPGDRHLAFTLFTFVPLSLVLAYLRGGSYRIGPGDSLNRMLLHVLPIAVLTIGLSAFGRLRRSPRHEIPASTTGTTISSTV